MVYGGFSLQNHENSLDWSKIPSLMIFHNFRENMLIFQTSNCYPRACVQLSGIDDGIAGTLISLGYTLDHNADIS